MTYKLNEFKKQKNQNKNNLSRLMFDTISLRKKFPVIMVLTNFLDIFLLRYNDLLQRRIMTITVPKKPKIVYFKFLTKLYRGE